MDKFFSIKEEGAKFNREVRKQVVSYVLAGFGVVAGLAWNEAIKSFIEFVFPLSQNGLRAKFLYAAIITVVIVVVSMYLVKLVKSDEEKK